MDVLRESRGVLMLRKSRQLVEQTGAEIALTIARRSSEKGSQELVGGQTYPLGRRLMNIFRCTCITDHGARIVKRVSRRQSSIDDDKMMKFWDLVLAWIMLSSTMTRQRGQCHRYWLQWTETKEQYGRWKSTAKGLTLGPVRHGWSTAWILQDTED